MSTCTSDLPAPRGPTPNRCAATHWARAFALLAVLLVGTSAAWAQVQRVKLIAPDAEYGDNFGRAVAIDGDWVLVGSPLDDDIAANAGAVYAYHRAGGDWSFTQKLTVADGVPSAQFGRAVALEGSVAVIGAYIDDPMGINNAGSAYVFERIHDVWIQRAKLWASDAAPHSGFGEAVDISAGAIVIGCRLATGVSWLSGLAYVFEGGGSSWVQTARLIPDDADQGDAFGVAVAIHGDRVVVGASNASLPSDPSVGAAYVFEKQSSGAWTQSQKLTPPGVMNNAFGFDVDLQGDWILVGGARGTGAAGPHAGAAYAFHYGAGSWRLMQELVGLDSKAHDKFGSWLALDGGVALFSGHQTDDMATDSGGGYAFSLQGDTWLQDAKLIPEDAPNESHLVGIELALSGRTAILGCAYDNSACPWSPSCHSGAAYIFDLATNVTQYGSCATSAPCANVDTHGGCRNWTGHGAVLQARGNTAYAADDLVLQVRDLPPNGYQRLYMGPLAMSAPFGNGQRVVAPGSLGYFRYPIQQASALGHASFGPGIIAHSQGFGAPGQIAAGQTWRFQSWYRDIAGPCGNLHNLSNGVSVTFAP